MKKKFKCPQCHQDTITIRQKYMAGIWQIIHCNQCNARLCGQPILMALAYALYFWAFAWFTFTAVLTHDASALIYLLPCWLLLDFLNINLMPLSIMKARTDNKSAE